MDGVRRLNKAQTTRLVQRRDGTIVEMRPGFRPRVLSRAEIQVLKEETRARRELDKNPFATMTKPPRIGGSFSMARNPPRVVGADLEPLGFGGNDAWE